MGEVLDRQASGVNSWGKQPMARDPGQNLQQNLNPLPALDLKTRSNLLKMELNLIQASCWDHFEHFARLPAEFGTYHKYILFQEGTIHGSTWF
jgi:hypothetical protein